MPFHIKAEEKDISSHVILVGDPGRAQKIGEKFLRESKLVNTYRTLYVYSGYYKDKKITVATTGMGAPSTAIVLEEIIKLGGRIFIRVGSAGGMSPEIEVGDIVIATGSIREDGTTLHYLPKEFPAVPDFDVLKTLVEVAKEKTERVFYGITLSTDVFYIPKTEEEKILLSKVGVKAVEMESGCVFIVSQRRGVKAGALFSIDGNVLKGIIKPPSQEELFRKGEELSIEIALESLYRL